MTTEASKCPVMVTAHQATGGTANQHWWPNQLNLMSRKVILPPFTST